MKYNSLLTLLLLVKLFNAGHTYIYMYMYKYIQEPVKEVHVTLKNNGLAILHGNTCICKLSP